MEDHGTGQEVQSSTGWGIFWWTLAAGLHIAAIVCIIYFTPLREWFLKRGDAGRNLQALEGPRMMRIARQMIEVHTRRIRGKVEQQQKVAAALAEVRDQRYQRYVEDTAARRLASGAPAAAEPLSVLGPAGSDTDVPLDRCGVVELYRIARTIEQATYGTYRHVRAIELARVQDVSLSEAAGATQVAVPVREDLAAGVFDQVIDRATDGKLEALKQELFKAHAEVSSMLAGALRMLDMANGLMAGDVGGTRVFGAGGRFEGSGPSLWGSDVGPNLAARDVFPGNSDGNFNEGFVPVGARKIMDDGTQAEWIYIDTWYIIGPFPNPGRVYMDKKFPPESAIDLDATYVGKDGLKLRWEFRQSPTLMIAPHEATNYAIWYAYTQLYSDRHQTLATIFGSDDYSKTWLNSRLIWTSGKTPHKWIPDRGYRKLNFRKGYNTILMKLENGPGTTGFSMAIYLGKVGP